MFKVGDKVKIKNRRGRGWNSQGYMDEYCGRIVTLTAVSPEYLECCIKEDGGRWRWNIEDFEIISNIDYSKELKEKERKKILMF